MVRDGELIKTPRKGLDSYFVVDTEPVDFPCCKNVDFQKDITPNHTDLFPLLKISVETPNIENTQYSSSVKDSFQDLLVAMKAYFMNEIYEMKNKICFLKSQLEAG